MGNIDKGSFYQQQSTVMLMHTGYNVFDQTIFVCYRTPFQLSFSSYLQHLLSKIDFQELFVLFLKFWVISLYNEPKFILRRRYYLLRQPSFKYYGMKKQKQFFFSTIYAHCGGSSFFKHSKKIHRQHQEWSSQCTMYPCLLQAIEMQTKQGVCHKKIRPKYHFLLTTTFLAVHSGVGFKDFLRFFLFFFGHAFFLS